MAEKPERPIPVVSIMSVSLSFSEANTLVCMPLISTTMSVLVWDETPDIFLYLIQQNLNLCQYSNDVCTIVLSHVTT